MMTEADLIKTIRQIIRREVANMMLCNITDTANEYYGSMQRFANEGEIENLRLIHPYGFASRPPEDTNAVVMPVAGDPTHLIILGQFDAGNRPKIDEGEAVLYGPDGQIIYMESGGDVTITKYVPASGTILPTYRAKFADDGTNTLKNLVGKIELKPTGEIDLDGGTGATHGAALGDEVESRLSAVENALSAFITSYTTHVHATAAPGPPSPPLPPGTPFVPIPIPVESQTVKVST